jgi:aryl-alcohol dehydrogenase-like predicted oxidoreductase
MELRPLPGTSGIEVSVVGLGCLPLGLMIDQPQVDAVVGAALDAGITFFDTADIYGGPFGQGEEVLAKALGARINDVVIATKFGAQHHFEGGGARAGAGAAGAVRGYAEDSLRRLGRDHIDLYQVHFPDPATPIDETLEALSDLVVSGKVRAIGCSNFAAWQLADAMWTAKVNDWAPFVTAQNRYSVLSRDAERELIPAAQHHDVALLPYFPLESGLLSGKYTRGEQAPEGTRLATWGGFADDSKMAQVEQIESALPGTPILDIAMGWLAAQPQVVSIIAGATKPEHVIANVAAAAWRPTVEQSAAIDTITR